MRRYELYYCPQVADIQSNLQATHLLVKTPLSRAKGTLLPHWKLSNQVMPEIWHDLVNYTYYRARESSNPRAIGGFVS